MTERADDIASQAAEWIVLLSSEDGQERTRAAAGFEAWKAADHRHAELAARMQGLIERTRGIGGISGDGGTAGSAASTAAHAALDAAQALERRQRRSEGRRRRASAAVALAVALALPGWLLLQTYPPAGWLADLSTATGQWRSETLADGTRLTLSSASAVNLRYDARSRQLELVRGEILVEVAHDAARPFTVVTGDGSVRALGTRFVVRNDGSGTTLSMLESRTEACPAQAGHAAVISAGQRVRIQPTRLGAIENIDGRSVDDAWKFHQLVVQGRPLPEVLDELSRFRPGHIRFDRERLAAIKVYAVLPLDDTDRALQLLVDSLPVLRVHSVTRYLVLVDAPAPR